METTRISLSNTGTNGPFVRFPSRIGFQIWTGKIFARPETKESTYNDKVRMDVMLNTKLVTWTLGLWTSITFVVCVIYGLVTPQSLHMSALLEQVLPAFKWLTWWGFLLGLAESFLYGAYAGLVFCPLYNLLHRRWGAK